MKPVELEIIMRDSTKEGMRSVEQGVGNVGKTVEQVTAEFKARMQEQSAVVKQVEADIKALEKQLEKTSPGKAKMELTADLNAAKQVLAEEKGELDALGKKVDETAQKHVSLRTQIAQMKQAMSLMTEGTDEYRVAMERLGNLQDQFGDITQQGRVMSDDEKGIKATADAVAGLTGAMTAAVGVASLFGMEEEKLAQIQTRLQAVMAITMGVQQVATTLNKDSYFTIVLLAKAKTMLTAANTRLSVSLGISTVAAKALMATLTLGVSVAIGALIYLWDRYSTAQSAARKETKDFQSKVSETAASSIASFRGLQNEWNSLGKSLKDKQKFIDDNQDAFKALGVSVRDAASAENLFVSGEAAFVESIINKAKAAAAMDMAAEKYKLAMQKMMEAEAMPDKVTQFMYVPGAAGRSTQLQSENRNKKNTEQAAKKLEQEATDLITKGLAYADEAKRKITESNVSTIDTIVEGSVAAIEASIAKKKEALAKLTNKKDYDAEMLKIKAEEKKLEAIIGSKKYTDETRASLVTKLADAELKARQKIEEMKLSIMVDGAAKEKAAARARFDAELLRIDQEKNERLEALAKAKKQGLPVTKGQVDTVTGQADDQRKGASAVYVKEFVDIEKEYADKRKKEFDDLLGKYQDYTAQRVAIEKTFNDDVAKLKAERDVAQQGGDTGRVESINRAIAQATAGKGRELIKLDFDQLKETPEYVRAFENLKETSSDTLSSLLSQLESAKSAAAQVLSPDQLREYTTTIQDIMNELDARNPFQTLADRKMELAAAEQELAKAKQQLDAVQGGGQVATGVKSSKFNKDTGKIESEKSYLTAAKAAQNYSEAQDNVAKKGAKVKKAEKEVKDVVGELSVAIKGVGDAIGGPAGEIINLIGDIGLFAMTAMGGVSTASETASKSIQAVEKASIILAIIGAAIQIAMKIASLFKDDDGVAEYERSKGVYESYITILDKVIEKQKELFELNSKVGKQAYDKAVETVKKQSSASRDLGKQYLDSGASKGFLGIGSSASEGVKQKDDMSTNALNQARKALGRDYTKVMDGRMTGLFDLSAKQLEKLHDDAPLFWAELHDDTQKYLQQIIDCNAELAKIESDRKEALVKTDFDSFYDGFLDTLGDMDADNKDFAANLEEYLKNSILSALLVDQYKDRIKSLYDNWASYTESGEELTQSEVDALRKQQEEIAADLLKKREELANAMGWKSEDEKAQQKGKAGSFTTITQDQGTKLEGLFTSVQGHVSNIDDAVKDISMMMYQAIDVLSQISEYTSYCTHLEQMAADIAELKRDGFKMK